VREALDLLAQSTDDEPAIMADFMRVRGFPFGDEVQVFLDSHDVCFVVEQNRDGQLPIASDSGDPDAKIEAAIGARLRRISSQCLTGHRRNSQPNGEIGMPSIVKPAVTHPSLQRNVLGLTVREYEGAMSTLCAGCGHDSVTAALVRALWESSVPPHMIAQIERHRLLVEDHRLLRQPSTRI